MNLSQLPYIISIAGTGSLLAASRELGVSQSALSHYLSGLERELGVDLFFRSKRKMYLTQAGQKYVRTARQILELIDGTQKTIAQLNQPAQQDLRIGVSPHSGARNLAENYAAFNYRFPSVKLIPREGYASELKAMLLKGEIDLCVTSGEEVKGLDWYPFVRSEIVLAVPASLSVSLPEETFLEDLSPFYTSVFILPQKPSALYDNVNAILDAAGFHPQVSFSTPNVTMLRQMISSGAGVGFLPVYSAAADPTLRLYHIHPAQYITASFYLRKGYAAKDAERYLMFLFLVKFASAQSSEALWTDFNKSLIWEYAPETAIALDWEEPV